MEKYYLVNSLSTNGVCDNSNRLYINYWSVRKLPVVKDVYEKVFDLRFTFYDKGNGKYICRVL